MAGSTARISGADECWCLCVNVCACVQTLLRWCFVFCFHILPADACLCDCHNAWDWPLRGMVYNDAIILLLITSALRGLRLLSMRWFLFLRSSQCSQLPLSVAASPSNGSGRPSGRSWRLAALSTAGVPECRLQICHFTSFMLLLLFVCFVLLLDL